MDEFDQIRRTFTDSQSKLSDVQAEGEQRRYRDRSFIVYAVVGLYTGSIGAAVLYLVIRGAYYNEDIFDNLSEIVKIAILPIVTLVIGYYFGTKEQASNPK